MTDKLKKQITGTFFVGLSILFAIGFFSTEGNLFNQFIKFFYNGIGVGVLLISYFCWITGIRFFIQDNKLSKHDLMLEVLAWILFSVCFLMIGASYNVGGIAGKSIYSSFLYVFGKFATTWIILIFLTVSLIITFKIDLVQVYYLVLKYMGKFKDKIFEMKKNIPEVDLSKIKMLTWSETSSEPEINNNENTTSENHFSGDKDKNFDDLIIDNTQSENFPTDEEFHKEETNEKEKFVEAEIFEEDDEEVSPQVKNKNKKQAQEKPKDLKNIIKDKNVEKKPPVENKEEKTNATDKKKPLKMPSLELLDNVSVKQTVSQEELKEKASKLLDTLKSFKIDAQILNMTIGPSVTRFELKLAPGIKVSKLLNLTNDIGVTLATNNIRIEAPIPGKSAIGIEIPNAKPMLVPFRELAYQVTKNENFLTIGLGKNINGEVVLGDISKMPHLLIAGSTGSGKSVCVNTIITSILINAHPDEVKFIMVDPKMVELSMYNGIPHLLIPVITDSKLAAGALSWAVNEMEERYSILAEEKVKKIEEYNKKMDKLKAQEESEEDYEKLPYIVVIIDELADLMVVARNEVEESIMRIAQKARAVGIHLLIATQRPSVNVITGVIKANLPSRISFSVQSNTDSRTILDTGGAENLIGKGDMLYWPIGRNSAQRIQGAFVSNEECERIVEYWVETTGQAEYDEEISEEIKKQAQGSESSSGAGSDIDADDELLPDAVHTIISNNKASISLLQRKLSVGHSRAARLMDMMEAKGIVSQMDQRNRREILINENDIDNYV
ncbi:MAG: DNA translocase FtsK [Candidatus Muiribacteriota bacterium]